MRRIALLLLLSACGAPRRHPEELEREAYARKLVEREKVQNSFRLASSYDVRFETGFSGIGYDPVEDMQAKAFRWIGQHSFVRLRPHGAKDMKLAIYGWIDVKTIHTKPAVTAYIDGQIIADMVVGDDGGFALVGTAPGDLLAGKTWVVLEIDVSSVGWHWFDPPALMVANINYFDWSEAP